MPPTAPQIEAARQHLEGLGWLLKSGLSYGAHFSLYRPAVEAVEGGDADGAKKPPAAAEAHQHAPFVVLVHAAAEPPGWAALLGAERVAAGASKRLMLAAVSEGSGEGGGGLLVETRIVVFKRGLE